MTLRVISGGIVMLNAVKHLSKIRLIESRLVCFGLLPLTVPKPDG